MAEQLKELIEKIQKEGIKAAEDKARSIEEEARQKAQAIIKEAQKEAEGLISQANDKAKRLQETTLASLKQVGRDVLLALKTEISDMLNKLIMERVREALTPQELAHILAGLIKEQGKAEVVVSLKKDDVEKLEKGFLAELNKHAQKGITLKASEDISGGFTISYDAGKSHFDFTDKALAEYIGLSLKPKLAEILLEAPGK